LNSSISTWGITPPLLPTHDPLRAGRQPGWHEERFQPLQILWAGVLDVAVLSAGEWGLPVEVVVAAVTIEERHAPLALRLKATVVQADGAVVLAAAFPVDQDHVEPVPQVGQHISVDSNEPSLIPTERAEPVQDHRCWPVTQVI
jgi:hypothetical protein